ncbi:MAG: hypothetical protein AB7E70_03030 [Hyphomicrobiaceae bacterium]
MNAASTRDTGGLIAGSLVPPTAYRDQSFWNEKFPALGELCSIKALIRDGLCSFNGDRSRNNSVLLVVMTDLGWQLLRDIGGIRNSAAELRHRLRWSREAIRALDLFEWTYAAHSALRHPTSKFPGYFWILANPCPTEEADKLVEAAETLAAALNVLVTHFCPESGYDGDVAAKRELARVAAFHWQAKSAGREST